MRSLLIAAAVSALMAAPAEASVTFTQKPSGIVDSRGYLHTADNPATFAWTVSGPTNCTIPSPSPNYTCTVQDVTTSWFLSTSAAGNAPGPEASPITDTSNYSGTATGASTQQSFAWAVNDYAILSIHTHWKECTDNPTSGYHLCVPESDDYFPGGYDFYFDTAAAPQPAPAATVPSTPSSSSTGTDSTSTSQTAAQQLAAFCRRERRKLATRAAALRKARQAYKRHPTPARRRAVNRTQQAWAEEQSLIAASC